MKEKTRPVDTNLVVRRGVCPVHGEWEICRQCVKHFREEQEDDETKKAQEDIRV